MNMVETTLEKVDNGIDTIYDEITSYGADLTVYDIVQRIKQGGIIIPSFQRDFFWTLSQSSRFIESLLLGLPVLGIFLAQMQETHKFLVVDGQQRLQTLLFFYEGVFPLQEKKQQVFKLTGDNIIDKYQGLGYKDLDIRDQWNLNESIIHITIIESGFLNGDEVSIYHRVYERLQML